ncbi:hypothetical protein Vadar_009419 [Vaccinium darrowii]|uniref:Uncharacterized protein n=1 Tax=Vaccinium darrowii TaxID=229202 RepID=A0ACB7YKY5_9ERIC|nr:hypothetical protein Vadar_009419 [Vaccinium darrowii]
MAEYERLRVNKIGRNLSRLNDLGRKAITVPMQPAESASKSAGQGKSKVVISDEDDGEYIPHVSEEGFGYSSDDDDSSGTQANQVQYKARQKKKKGPVKHRSRDFQGSREESNIIKGATSTPPTQPSTDHAEGMPMVAAQPTQLPNIAANSEGLNGMAPRKRSKGGGPESNTSPISAPQSIAPNSVVPRSTSTTSKKRGLSRGLGLQKRLRKEGKIGDVYFPDDIWKPLGSEASTYTNEVGVVCRMFANLSIPYWKDMTDEDKEPMFVRLAEEFVVDFSHPHAKAVTDHILNECYSDYRAQLYRRIKSFPSIEEARKHPDAEIDPNHWNHICDYMKSDKYIMKSDANKEKRSKVKVLHCSGSKSFVRRREELKESEMGRIEFYKETHCKEGVWASDGAEKKYKEMMELKNQHVVEGDVPMTEDQICDKVLGRAIGYVPGLGHGVRPNTSTKVTHATRVQLQESAKRVEEAERRANEANQRVEMANRKAKVAIRRAKKAERRAKELNEELITQRSTTNTLTQKINRLESFCDKLASRMDMRSSPH